MGKGEGLGQKQRAKNIINLVVEIDGGIHEQQKDYDKLRTEIISLYGIRVIRFTNEEVIDKRGRVMQRLEEIALG